MREAVLKILRGDLWSPVKRGSKTASDMEGPGRKDHLPRAQ